MKAELRKETPTGRVGAPRCFALVRRRRRAVRETAESAAFALAI